MLLNTFSFILHSITVLGEHQTAGTDKELSELTATIQDLETTPKLSRALPQHTCVRRRGRRSNTASPTHTASHNSIMHAYEGPYNFDTEEERDSEHKVVTFHGLILRSQLTEMFKNKIFFNESEGVSHINSFKILF